MKLKSEFVKKAWYAKILMCIILESKMKADYYFPEPPLR
jgi:hypothetical protein